MAQNLFLILQNKNGMKNTNSHNQKDVAIAEISAKMKGEKEMAKKGKETPVEEMKEEIEEVKEKTTPVKTVKEETKKKSEKTPKYPIGSIVYVSKEADADLNGFKLFSQYKKYTYTVEAYDAKSGVYSLRRLNLSLSLSEALIISPDERAHDMINRKQF